MDGHVTRERYSATTRLDTFEIEAGGRETLPKGLGVALLRAMIASLPQYSASRELAFTHTMRREGMPEDLPVERWHQLYGDIADEFGYAKVEGRDAYEKTYSPE